MRKITKAALLAVTLISSLGYSQQNTNEFRSFIPENNMYISEWDRGAGGISQSQFAVILNKVNNIYSPIVAKSGLSLKVVNYWGNGRVNASSSRSGNTLYVYMYGGLARHDAINYEAMVLATCHEVGHHLGGYPKKTTAGLTWSTAEGGSDYFASLKCMRKYFATEDNATVLAKRSSELDPFAVSRCNQTFSTKKDRLICIRSSLGAQSMADFFASTGPGFQYKFDTPSTFKPASVIMGYPNDQCRLDTYFAGMLCPVSDTQNLSNSDLRAGACYRGQHKFGFRPSCWFAQ
ncbi:MAG: hypothetical protein ACKOX6_17555 [Bdellovibrio sp.]